MLMVLGLVAATLAGLTHVAFFLLESVLFRRPTVWRRFGLRSPSDAEVARPWAFNQGFYNLFLALGVLVGVVAVAVEHSAGVPVLLFGCACMALAGAVLAWTDRRMVRAALIQAVPPAAAIVLTALA